LKFTKIRNTHRKDSKKHKKFPDFCMMILKSVAILFLFYQGFLALGLFIKDASRVRLSSTYRFNQYSLQTSRLRFFGADSTIHTSDLNESMANARQCEAKGLSPGAGKLLLLSQLL
jgi:hypothetical protein